MTATDTPPGPERPITMEEIRADPLGFLESMARDHGPLTYHRCGDDDVYMAFDPDLVHDVLMPGEDSFTKEATPDDLMLTPLLGEGLLTSHGQSWKRQRALTQSMFHRRRIEKFAPMMVEEARATAARWLEKADSGDPIRVDHDLSSLTLSIVARAVVGGDLSGIGRGFGTAVDAVNAFLSHGDPKDTPDTDEVRADAAAYPGAVRTLDGIVRLLIRAREAVSGADGDEGGIGRGSDLLAALLAQGEHDSCPLSKTEIRDQVMTMIMAGHETTAKALTWTLYLLDENPDERRELVKEVEDVLGDRDPTVADLPRLVRCRAAVHESLRLYPPIWVISRRAVRDTHVAGYSIPRGSLLCVSPWVVHRDPTLWKDPETFDPSRFLDESISAAARRYMPFGVGPRQCIGRGLAVMEAVLVLATLCRRVEMHRVAAHPVDVQALVTLRPRHGLVMTAHPVGAHPTVAPL